MSEGAARFERFAPVAQRTPYMARKNARAIDLAAAELRKVVPNAGSYFSESNYFNPSAQRRELSPAARGEVEIRSGRPVLRAPRRRQRRLERRRF